MKAAENIGGHGQHMTFQLSGQEYGLSIMQVREIIGYRSLTRSAANTTVYSGRDQLARQCRGGAGPGTTIRPDPEPYYRTDLHNHRGGEFDG